MMKYSHFSSLFNTLRNAPRHVSLYSTAAPKSHRKFWKGSLNGLYRQISRSDPKASVLPILDRWVQDSRTVDKDDLVTIIKELRYYKDYSQALEVSMWMSDKRYVELLPSDVAIRLDLIAKVHGIEQAENYFNNTPQQLKVLEVYSALLNCYAHAKQLEKAEATMQKMRDLGFSRTSLSYNVLLNLYYKTGHCAKFDSLMSEMEENGIGFDRFTYGIRLSAAAAASDLEGIDKILAEWESDPKSLLDWINYAVAANGYTKAGAVDKALAMLKRSEEQIPSSKRQRGAYQYLMTQYAVLGKKDNTLRLWKCYKEQMKVYNRGYICIMTSLSKFDDIENAEKIFEEWESEHANYDIRIPNTLIGAYTRNGFLDKAEAIMSRIRLKDEKPNPMAWNYLAKGYLDHGQIEKVLESATKAVSAAQPGWMPDKDVVVACLEYFKSKADLEGAEEFIKLLGDKNIIPVNMQERLLNHIKNENSTAVIGEMEWDCPNGDEETVNLQMWNQGSSGF
ncbi:pentatricopeptide repeat-containing protein At2g20710, mitochondrial-like [Rosa rugosa]|uniref:pentatricopeptide repeat-containing protein At2g20710, mitochondrial-like n=1 Tax=Rosa rugosa TaxID=74645 RepID=UPI002B416518|nr:pentatricopeptide repeat-containing protein At2g20710, mitochondrial-like [Rosa rugosa]